MQQNIIQVKVKIRNLEQQQPFAFDISLNQQAQQIVEKVKELLGNPQYKIVNLSLVKRQEIVNQAATLEELNIQNQDEFEVSFSNKVNIQIQHPHFEQQGTGIKQVELWNNPNDLKNLILKRNEMEICQYQVSLDFNGNPLMDIQTLQQQGVLENSLIKYSIKTTLQILQQQNNNPKEITFEVSEPLSKLFEIVKTQLQIQGSFYLQYDDQRLNSNDEKFFSLKIQNLQSLLLVVEETKLKIKKGNHDLPIRVNPEILIKEIEQIVKKSFNIQASFKLVYLGQDLDTQKTVREYNFPQNSKIDVIQINECPQQIVVYLINQNDKNRKNIVNANINYNIDILNSNFEDQQVKYYYNNQLLDKHKTFLDHEVKNNADIFYSEILGIDISLLFINTHTFVKKWIEVKTNQKLSDVILDLLNFPKFDHQPYYVIQDGKQIDNPEDTFDELEIKNQDILTYCSHILLLKVMFQNLEKIIQIEREATLFELSYVVKREFGLQGDVEIFQNEILLELNIKLNDLSPEFKVKEIQKQQPQQIVQPDVAQQVIGNQPNYYRKIVITLAPANVDYELEIDIRKTVRKLLKQFKKEQRLLPNQPIICNQLEKSLDEQIVLSSLQNFDNIILELSDLMKVYFLAKNSLDKVEIQVKFREPVEQVEQQLKKKLCEFTFTFKNKEIDIKKSFQVLYIAQLDIIYYEEKQQQIDALVIDCIVENQSGQEQQIQLHPKQTIKDLKNLCNLKNSNKALYLQANNIEVFENQEVGQICSNSQKLHLMLKDNQESLHIYQPSDDILPDINVTIIIGKQKKKLLVSQRNNNTIEGLKQQIKQQCKTEVQQELRAKKDRDHQIKLYLNGYLDDERQLQEYQLNNQEIEAITMIQITIKIIQPVQEFGRFVFVTDQILQIIAAIAMKESWGANLKGNNYSQVKLYFKEQELDINKRFYECNLYHKVELELRILQY